MNIHAFSVAALLLASVAVIPLAAGSASAQLEPQLQTDNSFDFGDDNPFLGNTTGMSFLVISGMSMVNGAKVAGAVMDGQDQISVTLTNENETGKSDALTIIAFAGTMDTTSMLANGSLGMLMEESSGGNSSIASMDDLEDNDNSRPGSGDDTEFDDSGMDSPSDLDDLMTEDWSMGNSTSFGHSMNPMEIFENMKMGSAVVQEGWISSQTVDITLVGNTTSTTDESNMTFVLVMIMPFTGEEQTQATLQG